MTSAGENSLEDRYKVGYIAAVNDFIKMELVEEESSEIE